MSPWAGDSHVIQSKFVGVDFAVSVALPYRYDANDDPVPLLVVLDAHWMFGTVRDLATSMAMGRLIPRALVVGIGYPTDNLSEIAKFRQRDATPTAATFPEGFRGSNPGSLGLGGASKFRNFLLRELLPWIEQHYRIGPPKMLIGHSMTALFTVQTLLIQPEAFDGYLAASPSLWWDKRVMLTMAADLLQQRTDLPARVYLSAGAEEARPPPESFQMVANVTALAERLAGSQLPGLQLTFEVLPGENHHSPIGQSVSRGLRALLSPFRDGDKPNRPGLLN